MGIGSAHKDGFIWSYKKNYKIIVTMDTDGTHDPQYIKFLIEEFQITNPEYKSYMIDNEPNDE